MEKYILDYNFEDDDDCEDRIIDVGDPMDNEDYEVVIPHEVLEAFQYTNY